MGLKKASIALFLAAALPFIRQLVMGAAILDDDLFLQSLPAWEWLGRTLRAGESPLWSPETLSGFPIAFTQYPFLYPPDLLLAWMLPGAQAYSWALVLHLLLAGILTFVYCRLIGLRFCPALLAALCFELSSEVVAGSSGFAAMSAFAFPGSVLGVELVLRGRRWGGPALALVVAASLLGGHPQLVLMALASAGCYALFRLFQSARSMPVARVSKTGLWLALAATIGVFGSAVRLLPTWNVVELSTRAAGLPPDAGSSGALSLPGLLLSYLLPLSRMETAPWGAAGYVGPVVLLLALAAVPVALRLPYGRFYLVLASVSALLSLGEATPLWILTRLPLASFFREPARFSLIASFAICVLGGMGMEELAAGKRLGKGRAWRVVVAVSVLAAVASFAVGGLFQFGSGSWADALRSWSQQQHVDLLNPWRPRMMLAFVGLPLAAVVVASGVEGRLSRTATQVALISISAAILVPLAAILSPAVESDVLARTPDTVGFLEQQSGEYRVFGHRSGVRLYNHMQFYGPGPEAAFSDDLRYRYEAAMLTPILNLRWGIDSADGYEQLHSVAQDRLLRFIDAERISDWAQVDGRWAHVSMEDRARVMSLLNVGYLLSYVDLSQQIPSLRLAARLEVAPGSASRAPLPVYLFENPSVLSRYYFVHGARVFDHDGELLDAVAYGEMDPRKEVAFLAGEEPVSAASSAQTISSSDSVGPIAAKVVSQHNTEVELEVVADRPGYLVTSDSYWPGWRAFVDGREVPVLRSNAGGRTVEITAAGAHRVVFSYEPVGLMGGIALSILAAVAAIGWMVVSSRSATDSSSTLSQRPTFLERE